MTFEQFNHIEALLDNSSSPLLIQHGTVVDHDTIRIADVLVVDGVIEQIADHVRPISEDTRIVDAKGLYVMPGGIDVHTHFNIDAGMTRSCDDFFTGTRAAACGGTTMIIDHMGFGPKGCDLFHQLDVYHEYARDKAVIDYSFHGVIQHIDERILSQMEEMVHQRGISSFKLYMTYTYKLDDCSVLKALTQLKKVGALTTVHPENDAALSLKRQQFISEGKVAPKYHALSRPLECEAEAIARVINLAKLADSAPLYIVHLSNGLGLDYTRLARQNQQPVWVETCPQYLVLDSSCYDREDALKYVLSPPLRDKEENDKLWQGLRDGSIDTVATDHCSFTFAEQKQLGAEDFTKTPNGIPGVETRMPLLFSEGVMAGRITPNQFVSLTSYQPAKLFGLYPNKGHLGVGADADIVLFDPGKQQAIRHINLHDNADYTPYESIPCKGWPLMTFSRGKLVAYDGEFTGEAGDGHFVHRKPFSQSSY
ncbi:dihydropyrimidinase [Vibrio hangzhouensis]|uniref:Dihydropyrimidinase n=1 Tax=Vibrio hangzhouensis TaxID=462991 RepID=A0A1H5S431_9VIBR|nr:dihydropyrimidinase [Vibrio hangzhouensis]SEF45376.1 dihydropyrimidinase [Vibrio hangzhouensis]